MKPEFISQALIVIFIIIISHLTGFKSLLDVEIFITNLERMKLLKFLFSLIFLGIILSACTTNIEFSGEVTAPKVVVHSFVSPDSVVSAYVSLSTFFLSDTLKYKHPYDADVSLYVNGEFKEKLKRVYERFEAKFRGSYKPTVNDILKIVVKVPSMDEVYAEVGFCKPPVIISVDTTTRKIESLFYTILLNNDTLSVDYTCNINIKLKFADNASEENYYRLIVMQKYYTYKREEYKDVSDWTWKWILVETTRNYFHHFQFIDPVAGSSTGLNPVDELSSITGETITAAETYNVFSDELINGKIYSLSCNTSNVHYSKRNPNYGVDSKEGRQYSYNTHKTEVFVSLQAISEEYYYYLKSRGASAKDDFFSEPVQILSNIRGGIGFVGAYSTSNVFSFMIE